MVAQTPLPTSTTPDSNTTFQSLCIPLTQSSTPSEFVEIFPEEIPSIPPSTLTTLLTDEEASIPIWTHAALLYMTNKRETESMEVLESALKVLVEEVQEVGGSVGNEEKVRLLTSKGIAYLTQQLQQSSGNDPSSAGDGMDPSNNSNNDSTNNAETIQINQRTADDLFTRATQIDQVFPMTWIGQGLLNLAQSPSNTPSTQPNKYHKRARQFFQFALSDRGQILPALLGLALLSYHQADYPASIKFYSDAIR